MGKGRRIESGFEGGWGDSATGHESIDERGGREERKRSDIRKREGVGEVCQTGEAK